MNIQIMTQKAQFIPEIARAEIQDACEWLSSPVKVVAIKSQYSVHLGKTVWHVQYQAPIWQNNKIFWLISAPIKSIEIPSPSYTSFAKYDERCVWAMECAEVIVDDNEPAIWLDTIPGERPQWLAIRFKGEFK